MGPKPSGARSDHDLFRMELVNLKHVYAMSDEDVVQCWCENPYWQHFSGERYFRHDLPCDPSSLVPSADRTRLIKP